MSREVDRHSGVVGWGRGKRGRQKRSSEGSWLVPLAYDSFWKSIKKNKKFFKSKPIQIISSVISV